MAPLLTSTRSTWAVTPQHLKELEDRVFSLEQQSQDQSTENGALKQLLQQLQSENERLKVFETAFSFTYQDAKNMPSSSQFKPPTPPTAQDEVTDLSSFGGAFSFGNTSPGTSTYQPSVSGGPSLFGLLSNSPLTYSMPSASIPAGATPSGLEQSLFLSSFSVPSPASTTGADSIASGSSASAANTSVVTPPDDLFSAYRDPSASFGVPSMTSLNDLDTLFGGSGGFGSAGGVGTLDGLDDFSAFLTSPSPQVASTSSVSPPAPAPALAPTPSSSTFSPISPSGYCPLGLDKTAFLKKQSEEPFSFDLDNLCSDLKAKAVCQEAARQALAAAMAEDSSLDSMFPSKQ